MLKSEATKADITADRPNRDIKRAIRELKREMKANGIPVSSCFNGGHTRESMGYNQRLFALKAELAGLMKVEG